VDYLVEIREDLSVNLPDGRKDYTQRAREALRDRGGLRVGLLELLSLFLSHINPQSARLPVPTSQRAGRPARCRRIVPRRSPRPRLLPDEVRGSELA
jgi:hypothetical protein